MSLNKKEIYDKSIENTLERCRQTLIKKNQEYAPEFDPLNNFKEGAEVSGLTEEQVLFMYMTKHLVSIRDIVFGKVPANRELIREKTGDIINYLVLYNAILDEREGGEK